MEGHIVGVGMSDAVWAKPFRSSSAFSPIDLPSHHMVLAWVMHPTVGSRAKARPVNLGQDPAPYRD
jgi:hypothetical protein